MDGPLIWEQRAPVLDGGSTVLPGAADTVFHVADVDPSVVQLGVADSQHVGAVAVGDVTELLRQVSAESGMSRELVNKEQHSISF